MTLDTVFSLAIEIESVLERAVFLDQACTGNPELRREVETLVNDHFRAGAFMEQPLACLADLAAPAHEGPGEVIGPYRLVEQIGEGGFGVVYLAEQQQPIRRKVALKILKPGMDARHVVARFEAERQALALMDHPNIAQVFDGGEASFGRPYFVMELVRGISITTFCDQHHLSVPERLELFISVCMAVQHAHQKGIIHRDLKPSNVMAAMLDGTPAVKVIDFGIAKALGQELTDKSLVTGLAQMIGTPLYMSPEQAGHSGLDIDTRSDIYALGVLLYELLTGTTPFTMERCQQATYDEIRRMIREEDPPRPSTRLLESKDTLPTVSAQRKTQPERLTRLLRGELDWIVMKALDKDRARRYETANSLALDVRRYLSDEVVQARPPSARYRLRKFVHRHRAPVLAGAAVLLALVAGFAGTAWGLLEAVQANANEAEQRQAAVANAAKAKGEEVLAKIARDQAEALAHKERTAREEREKQLLRAEWLLYASQINLAQQAWQSHNAVLTRHYLNSCRKDFRGWEHDYLFGLLHGIPHKIWRLDATPVRCIALTADGKRLISGGTDGSVRAWDVDTGQVTLTIGGHGSAVSHVAVSADGQRIVSGHSDPQVVSSMKVWNAATGEEIRTFKRPKTWITGLVLSGDGKRLVSGCGDGVVQLYNVDTGQTLLNIKTLSTATGALGDDVSVALSADGQRIVSSARRGKSLKVWDAATGQESLACKDTVQIWSVALSPDGKRMVSGGEDGAVKVWDTATGHQVVNIKGHYDVIYSLALSADGQRIVSGGFDNTVRVWDAITGQDIRTFKGHISAVNVVTVSGDGQRVVSVSSDRTIRAWDASLPEEAPILRPPGDRPFRTTAALSPDSKRIVTATLDGALHVWDAATGQVTLTINREEPGHHLVTSLAFSPDGKWIVGNYDHAVRVWDAATGQVLRNLQGHTDGIMQVALAPNGKHLVSANRDGTVKVWDEFGGVETRALDGHLGPTNKVFVVCRALSPDAKHVGGGWSDGTVQVWEVATGKIVLSVRGHTASVNGVALSPDGKRIASASMDRTVKVWDLVTGNEAVALRGHTDGVAQVAWMPDGKRIVSRSFYDKTVKVWDAATGFETLTLKGTLMAISPDGKRILYLSADGTLRFWGAGRKQG